MFEKASRLALRFESPKGLLSVEDLWNLPLTSQTGKANLDDLAQELHQQLERSQERSFVKPATSANEVSKLKFDLVIHVINTKVAEADAARVASDKKAQREKIMEIMARKQDAALEGASMDELRAMLDKL